MALLAEVGFDLVPVLVLVLVHCLAPFDAAGAGGARAQGDSAGTHLPPAGRAGCGGARANDPGASCRAEENQKRSVKYRSI